MTAPTRTSLPLLRSFARILIVVALGFAVATFGFTTVRVEGDSMNPTLVDGERAFVPRFEVWMVRAGWRAWQPGDIVYFTPPNLVPSSGPLGLRDDAWVIKRVIAVGPATVRIAFGDVWVNDVKQPEPYLVASGGPTHHPEVRVPEGHLFVLGDNRAPLASRDSRVFGSVPEVRIAGRAAWVVWPLIRLSDANGWRWNLRRL